MGSQENSSHPISSLITFSTNWNPRFCNSFLGPTVLCGGRDCSPQFAWGKQCDRVLVCTREKKTMKLIITYRDPNDKSNGPPEGVGRPQKNDETWEETWLAQNSLRFRPSPPWLARDTARSAIHLKGIREEAYST